MPLGAFGLSAFAVDLYFAATPVASAELVGAGAFLACSGSVILCVDLAGIAMFGGFYIVPLYALIQHRSEPSHRSRVIAANNTLNAGFVFHTSRAIPIAPRNEDEALIHKAFDDVAAALKHGDVVGIFTEGVITHTGDMNEFKNGVEKIVECTPVPIVPLALKGL